MKFSAKRFAAPALNFFHVASLSVMVRIASAMALLSRGATFIPETPSSFTQETPDSGIFVATTGLPADIASIWTIPKASVFITLLMQNSSQAP